MEQGGRMEQNDRMTCKIIRKSGREETLREEWHDMEDGSRMLLLKYPLLEQTGLVKHCFTTRSGGVSEGIFSSMNLSFTRGDDRKAVETNFRRLAGALDVDYEKFVFTDQTHTVNVRKVTAEDAGCGLTRERGYADVDGLITDVPGIVLSTFYADCVPLYFVDPVHRAIGMSHSGWRGTAARMGSVTLQAMEREYGTKPGDVLCAIGPSICQDCYEVSEDVAEAFREAFPGHEEEILKESPQKAENAADIGKEQQEKRRQREESGQQQERGQQEESGQQEGQKYQLDLWKANELVLLEAGVLPEHLAVTDICTCCNPEVLFSHRASHGKRGNLGGFLCLK